MPGRSGLDAAQALAEDWPADGSAPPFPLLVFVTAYDQYALQAFERAAVDYLLKPVDAARLALLHRAAAGARWPSSARRRRTRRCSTRWTNCAGCSARRRRRSAVPRLDVIQAGVGNTVHMVPVDDVIYFEAADKYVRVVTAEREHLIRTSLRELLPQLDRAALLAGAPRHRRAGTDASAARNATSPARSR